MQVNRFVLTLSTLLINRCAAVSLHMQTQRSIAKQRKGEHEGLKLPWRRKPLSHAAGIVRYSSSLYHHARRRNVADICLEIIVLTVVMSYAGLVAQMRHARRSLSRAWQQNMLWICAKQLFALRYSFLVLLVLTPDSSFACIVNMEINIHMDTIQRALTAAIGQIYAGLPGAHTLHIQISSYFTGVFAFLSFYTLSTDGCCVCFGRK